MAMALLCLGALAGCATRTGPHPVMITLPPPSAALERFAGPPPSAAPPSPLSNTDAQQSLAYIDILYGTDRTPGAQPGEFGDGRNGKLTLGLARVTIPPNHTPGIVERPAEILVLRFREDAQRHLTLVDTPLVLTKAEFVQQALRAYKGALLFVHGYNTDFDDGLFRTAQLAHDLNFKGYAFHYSWPSRGTALDYDYDNDSERQAKKYFADYLRILINEAKAQELTIIVHSKGNDMVLSALNEINGLFKSLKPSSLNQLVLASPDIDSTIAKQILPNLAGKFSRITLYANDRDIPLNLSKAKAGGVPRAGQLMADGRPIIIAGVDSIDATAADMDWSGLNHNAYIFDDRLRADLQGVVAGKGPPEARTNYLDRIVEADRVFWRLR
jgi:esterase/lipase superfamily enzyme